VHDARSGRHCISTSSALPLHFLCTASTLHTLTLTPTLTPTLTLTPNPTQPQTYPNPNPNPNPNPHPHQADRGDKATGFWLKQKLRGTLAAAQLLEKMHQVTK
jgi:hypothetical protein